MSDATGTMNKPLLRASEARALLGVGRDYWIKLTDAGLVPAIRVPGSKPRYRRVDVLRLINEPPPAHG